MTLKAKKVVKIQEILPIILVLQQKTTKLQLFTIIFNIYNHFAFQNGFMFKINEKLTYFCGFS